MAFWSYGENPPPPVGAKKAGAHPNELQRDPADIWKTVSARALWRCVWLDCTTKYVASSQAFQRATVWS